MQNEEIEAIKKNRLAALEGKIEREPTIYNKDNLALMKQQEVA